MTLPYTPTADELVASARNLKPIDDDDPGRGYRVKLSADGRHHVDLLRMLYNWRIAATPVSCPKVIDRAWCYFGLADVSFRKALLAALVWDGADDTEPVGYDKRAGT